MRDRIALPGGILVLLFCAWAAAAMAAELEIITLRHRSADEVLPALKPLLEPGGSLSGMNDKLFVRAGASNRAQIRHALAAIDRAPRRLMITVKHDNEANATAGGAELAGRIGRGEDSVRARVYSSRGSASDRLAQQVQVIEGGQAFIAVGYSFPVPLRRFAAGPHGAAYTESVVYRDLASGFYAQPMLSGDRVTLEISPQQESLSATEGGAVRSQRLATTVSGRLGEWIELGGTVNDAEAGERGVTRYSTRGNLEARRVLLKVEELP